MDIQDYLQKIDQRLKNGHTSEHTFRGDLEQLLNSLLPEFQVINEPSKITDCGNPDYVITKNEVPIGYIEAKDIGKDLDSRVYNEQFSRYKKGLSNLIITDYIRFQFFKDGEKVGEISLAAISGQNIHPLPDSFDKFTAYIRDFSVTVSQVIKSSSKLAELMAGKARLLQCILLEALESDIENSHKSELAEQFETFKQMLIHDLETSQFADLYAQTLAYGMFAARYHDETLDSFDRDEAARLIPKTNPLLRNLFQSIGGYNIDDRIRRTVDNLAEVFSHTDVKSILRAYGPGTHKKDPIIHFYEEFLANYDSKVRKTRGVWYTPEPVVKFMVRAVDFILKEKFDIKDGISSNSKTTIEVDGQVRDNRTKSGYRRFEKEVHRVQILDPATGTGTFLAEIIRYIFENYFAGIQGAWQSYVDADLLPRLHGFELLMASYAMAHLKLDMLLGETGYTNQQKKRFRVFLTNSLEEYHPDTHNLFAEWLSSESREANSVKKDAPVMVVIGNPPYSGESINKGDWIMSLMDDYKKEPDTTNKLKEKNSKWINDDYVKFIRFAHHFIEKNGEGVIAYINPHGFLDNPTFRGMRSHLLKTFDEIYSLDLHGNSNRNEVGSDGAVDENVFDIEQGVSINFFIKNNSRIKTTKDMGQIFHHEIYGKRKTKYEFLDQTHFQDIPYQELPNVPPAYLMVPRDYDKYDIYKRGISLDSLFMTKGNGVVTKRDKLCIQDDPDKCLKAATDIINLEKDEFYKKYSLPKDVRDWRYEWARQDILDSGLSPDLVKQISYRPFDERYIYYTGRSRGFVGWPVSQIMSNYLSTENIGLLTTKATRDKEFNHVFVTRNISEAIFLSGTSGSNAMNFPLFRYEEDKKKLNLNPDIVELFEKKLGVEFDHENFDVYPPLDPIRSNNKLSSIQIFSYVYASLHDSEYKRKNNEFLKSEYPYIPLPEPRMFWDLVDKGNQLIVAHLLDFDSSVSTVASYPSSGTNQVITKFSKNDPGLERLTSDTVRVWINTEQYFDNIPIDAWYKVVGGYQPAEKWLKDRRGKKLSYDEIKHYQKIIQALHTTVLLDNVQCC